MKAQNASHSQKHSSRSLPGWDLFGSRRVRYNLHSTSYHLSDSQKHRPYLAGLMSSLAETSVDIIELKFRSGWACSPDFAIKSKKASNRKSVCPFSTSRRGPMFSKTQLWGKYTTVAPRIKDILNTRSLKPRPWQNISKPFESYVTILGRSLGHSTCFRFHK